MLGFFKNKSKGKVICSPCNGRVVPITEVPDPTFSEKILGDGVAVIPSEGRFYAPADGEVTAVFRLCFYPISQVLLSFSFLALPVAASRLVLARRTACKVP